MAFQKGNQFAKGKGRPTGSGYSTLLRETVGKEGFKEMVEALYTAAKGGDMQAASILMARLAPPLKPTSEPIRITLPDQGHAEQAKAVLKAIADGDLSPADGKVVADIISASAALTELSELTKRIEALETRRG